MIRHGFLIKKSVDKTELLKTQHSRICFYEWVRRLGNLEKFVIILTLLPIDSKRKQKICIIFGSYYFLFESLPRHNSLGLFNWSSAFIYFLIHHRLFFRLGQKHRQKLGFLFRWNFWRIEDKKKYFWYFLIFMYSICKTSSYLISEKIYKGSNISQGFYYCNLNGF